MTDIESLKLTMNEISLNAKDRGLTPELLENLLNDEKRSEFLEGLNEDFKTLKEDAQAWQKELEERNLWK